MLIVVWKSNPPSQCSLTNYFTGSFPLFYKRLIYWQMSLALTCLNCSWESWRVGGSAAINVHSIGYSDNVIAVAVHKHWGIYWFELLKRPVRKSPPVFWHWVHPAGLHEEADHVLVSWNNSPSLKLYNPQMDSLPIIKKKTFIFYESTNHSLQNTPYEYLY